MRLLSIAGVQGVQLILAAQDGAAILETITALAAARQELPTSQSRNIPIPIIQGHS